MDEKFVREHVARCRRLAEKADEATARRLLALAARCEKLLQNWHRTTLKLLTKTSPKRV